MAPTPAADWTERLAARALPPHVLAGAPADPWALPVDLFRVRAGQAPRTPSRRRALEALPDVGTVLDVGCGGGRAGLALAPPAARVVGVDRSAAMLAAFAEAAASRGLRHEEIEGQWPDAASRAPVAHVAVCHHVAYNVGDLEPFALALEAHAERRVVLELTDRHPLSWLDPLWRRFWGLERPDGPTARDAHAVLRGIRPNAQVEFWDEEGARGVLGLSSADRVAFVRTRLCLPADRDPEVAGALAEVDLSGHRRMAAIWWDVAPRPRRE